MEKVWLKNYPEGVSHEIDLTAYNSLAEILEEVFDKYGDLPSFHNMGTTITYKELRTESRKFASYLQNDLKLKKGDRVALMMPNILQYPITLFGILQAGMIAVNVNPLYTARELEHQLKDSGAKAIVIFENSASILEDVLANTEVKHVITTQIGDLLKFPKSMIVNFVLKRIKKMVPPWNIPNTIKLTDALKAGNEATFKKTKNKRDDAAFLQYTGGTTGVAKGAILTHGNILANLLQCKAWLDPITEVGKEIIVTPLPLYHIFSLTANCLVFSYLGGLNILITNPRDISGFIKELGNWKYTAVTGVNTLFNGLINHPDFKKLDFSSLRLALGGGMAVQKAVADEWTRQTKTPLIEAYGLTETSPAAFMNPLTLKDFNGYIGLPIPSTEGCIKDDNEKDLPFGEIGELCIKGPQVMKGYWNRPEETAKVMTKDGFLKTGDMAFMTNEGYVKIVDRKKDMILVSGFNVYPNEVEDVAVTHPNVLECAAVGVPDEKSGEVVKLFVVKKDGDVTEEELKEFCKKSLTGYKVPKIFEFRDELPKTNVGKILRKDLR